MLTKIDFTKIPEVFFIGDVHGQFSEVVNDLRTRKKLKDALVICCGDIGCGFYNIGYYIDLFRRLNERLTRDNITLAFVRGNHDNAEFFNETEFVSKKLTEFSHIRFIPDYSILMTTVGNILCVGGAISIDRKARVDGKSYWQNEPIIPLDDELREQLSSERIDIVVTHSTPTVAPPTQKYVGGWCIGDISLISDMENERKTLQELYEYLKERNEIKHWVYGHYHAHYDTIIDGTRFHCCDMFRDGRGNPGTDIYYIH